MGRPWEEGVVAAAAAEVPVQRALCVMVERVEQVGAGAGERGAYVRCAREGEEARRARY